MLEAFLETETVWYFQPRKSRAHARARYDLALVYSTRSTAKLQTRLRFVQRLLFSVISMVAILGDADTA